MVAKLDRELNLCKLAIAGLEGDQTIIEEATRVAKEKAIMEAYQFGFDNCKAQFPRFYLDLELSKLRVIDKATGDSKVVLEQLSAEPEPVVQTKPSTTSRIEVIVGASTKAQLFCIFLYFLWLNFL